MVVVDSSTFKGCARQHLGGLTPCARHVYLPYAAAPAAAFLAFSYWALAPAISAWSFQWYIFQPTPPTAPRAMPADGGE